MLYLLVLENELNGWFGVAVVAKIWEKLQEIDNITNIGLYFPVIVPMSEMDYYEEKDMETFYRIFTPEEELRYVRRGLQESDRPHHLILGRPVFNCAQRLRVTLCFSNGNPVDQNDQAVMENRFIDLNQLNTSWL